MQLLLEPKNVAELEQLKESGSLSSVGGVMLSHKYFKEPSSWPEEIEAMLQIAPSRPIIGLVPINCIEASDMIKIAEILARVPGTKSPAITFPPTWQGFNASRTLTKRGMNVCIGPCETVFHALLAARADAEFVVLFNYDTETDVNAEDMKLVKDIKDKFANYPDIKSKILVTSIQNENQLDLATSNGANAVCVSGDLLTSLTSNDMLLKRRA